MNPAVSVLVTAVAAGLLCGCGASLPETRASPESFRDAVLECPASLPLPGRRLPSCAVALDRLLDYGEQACTWLASQPPAQDPGDMPSTWRDPAERGSLAASFARETSDSRAVPLEQPERSIVASLAWQHLCPELDDRYNTVEPQRGLGLVGD